MTALALLRHGKTEWNAAGFLQGRQDVPLSAAGRAQVAGWRLPPDLDGWHWQTSPLRRARATAEILSGHSVAADPRLVEMHWGAWEGPDGAAARAAARRSGDTDSLDRRPPGGESLRDVQHRVAPWLAAVATAGRPTIAVTHKGVILAIYARATGWDVTGPPPDDLVWDAVHRFTLAADGTPAVDRLSDPL